MTKTKAYCVPWNAGLASETGAVCRRIGRLMTAMDTEIKVRAPGHRKPFPRRTLKAEG